MPLDSFFTHHIEQSSKNALSDYYSRKEGDPFREFPANPYNPRTQPDQYRAWRDGANAAACEQTMRQIRSNYK